MYSQNDEESIILANVPETGRFLDIGAYDGKTFSNVLALIEKGWEGICVEASPDCFAKLQKLHCTNDKIVLVNALIGVEWRLRKFFNNDAALATSEQINYEKWYKHTSFREIFLPELPLNALLKKFPGPYDFVNIDTEGSSWPLLLQFDFAEIGTKLVCVEYDQYEDEIRAYFDKIGFQVVHKTTENIIAKKLCD